MCLTETHVHWAVADAFDVTVLDRTPAKKLSYIYWYDSHGQTCCATHACNMYTWCIVFYRQCFFLSRQFFFVGALEETKHLHFKCGVVILSPETFVSLMKISPTYLETPSSFSGRLTLRLFLIFALQSRTSSPKTS